MVKKFTYLLSMIAILFVLFTTFLPQANAEAEKQRIYDFAEVLSDKDQQDLEKIAATYSDKEETDFIFLTIDELDTDITEYMADFYDDEGLGYDREHGNTAIIALNLHREMRDVQLAGFGKAEKYLDDHRMDLIRSKVTPDLSDGNYKDAFTGFVTLSSKYMRFKVGANPDNPFYNPWIQIGLSILIGVVVVFLLARNPGMKKTVNASTYQDGSQSKIINKRDRYIRKTVTKRRKPKPNKSGGGGGISGGGMTGGGRSFSGSRGKF